MPTGTANMVAEPAASFLLAPADSTTATAASLVAAARVVAAPPPLTLPRLREGDDQNAAAVSRNGGLLLPALSIQSPGLSPPLSRQHCRSPSDAGLRLQTDLANLLTVASHSVTGALATEKERGGGGGGEAIALPPAASLANSALLSASSATPAVAISVQRSSALRSTLSAISLASSQSPRSTISSPSLTALADVTPLPSPLVAGESPGSWRKFAARPASSGSQWSLHKETVASTPATILATSTLTGDAGLPFGGGGGSGSGNSLERMGSWNRRKKSKKTYRLSDGADVSSHSLKNDSFMIGAGHGAFVHMKTRSASEMSLPRARPIPIVGCPRAPAEPAATDPVLPGLHREHYLAIQRGLAFKLEDGPLPAPASLPGRSRIIELETSLDGSKEESVDRSGEAVVAEDKAPSPVSRSGSCETDCVTVRQESNRRPIVWWPVRQLGQGTFSKVILAMSERAPGQAVSVQGNGTADGIADADGQHRTSSLMPATGRHALVAIKIIEHGPAGGADEQRVELSLKREIEIMKSISHPSIVHLKAFDLLETRALLVLNYCPGGDLFDLASAHRDLLEPVLVQRIVAELVDATRHLHNSYIVHRDIKLESE